MPKPSLREITQRKNFYRNAYHKALKIFLFLQIVLIITIGASSYVITHMPETRYYATNSVGFILPLKGLSGPNMSRNPLLPPDPPSLSDGQLKELDVK